MMRKDRCTELFSRSRRLTCELLEDRKLLAGLLATVDLPSGPSSLVRDQARDFIDSAIDSVVNTHQQAPTKSSIEVAEGLDSLGQSIRVTNFTVELADPVRYQPMTSDLVFSFVIFPDNSVRLQARLWTRGAIGYGANLPGDSSLKANQPIDTLGSYHQLVSLDKPALETEGVSLRHASGAEKDELSRDRLERGEDENDRESAIDLLLADKGEATDSWVFFDFASEFKVMEFDWESKRGIDSGDSRAVQNEIGSDIDTSGQRPQLKLPKGMLFLEFDENSTSDDLELNDYSFSTAVLASAQVQVFLQHAAPVNQVAGSPSEAITDDGQGRAVFMRPNANSQPIENTSDKDPNLVTSSRVAVLGGLLAALAISSSRSKPGVADASGPSKVAPKS